MKNYLKLVLLHFSLLLMWWQCASKKKKLAASIFKLDFSFSRFLIKATDRPLPIKLVVYELF